MDSCYDSGVNPYFYERDRPRPDMTSALAELRQIGCRLSNVYSTNVQHWLNIGWVTKQGVAGWHLQEHLGVRMAELHRKHQAANPAAPGASYIPPTDAEVDDWKVYDDILKYSSEEKLEGAMKVIF